MKLCNISNYEHSKKIRCLQGRWDYFYCTDCDLVIDYCDYLEWSGKMEAAVNG